MRDPLGAEGLQRTRRYLFAPLLGEVPGRGMDVGLGQPRISARRFAITAGPSTGSVAPTAMKVGPRHSRCSQSRARR